MIRKWKGRDIERLSPSECRQALRDLIDAVHAKRRVDEEQERARRSIKRRGTHRDGMVGDVFDAFDGLMTTVFGK